MKNEDLLFNLIKSLTASEKRYFVLFVGRGDSAPKNKYTELFKAISRQSVYIESSLIRKLGYEQNPNGFSVVKNYLYQQILKSLRSYHTKDSAGLQFALIMVDIEILYHKGLYKNAAKILQRAMRLAQETNSQKLIYSVLQWEFKLAEYSVVASDYLKEHNRILDLQKTWFDDFSEIAQISSLYYELKASNLSGCKVKLNCKFEEAFKALESRQSDPDSSLMIKLSILNFFCEYHKSQKQPEQHYHNCQKRLEIYQRESFLRANLKPDYLLAITEYLDCLLVLKRYNEFRSNHHLLLDFKVPGYFLHLQYQKDSGIRKIMSTYYVYTGQLGKMTTHIIPLAEENIASNERSLNRKPELWCIAMIVVTYLALKKYNKALHYYHLLTQHLEWDLYQDYALISKLIGMMLHNRLGNLPLVNSISKSILHYLNARNIVDPLLEAIVVFFRKLVLLKKDHQSAKQLMLNMKKRLSQFEKDILNRSVIDVVIFNYWLDYLLSGKPLSFVFRQGSSNSDSLRD